jgi:HTH-type transcriptional regulator / antitoxin HigA
MKNEHQYRAELARAEEIMLKGSENLSQEEALELKTLAGSISAYEAEHFPLPKPQSLQAMIEWKMFELRLKQTDLAKLLDEPSSRISEILSGKRAINMRQAKKLHKALNIPAEFILEHA